MSQEQPTSPQPKGGRILWFAVGFVGGIFGMCAAWLITSSWPSPVRRRAVWSAWAGFLVQAGLAIVLLNSGLMPQAGFAPLQAPSPAQDAPVSPAFG